MEDVLEEIVSSEDLKVRNIINLLENIINFVVEARSKIIIISLIVPFTHTGHAINLESHRLLFNKHW